MSSHLPVTSNTQESRQDVMNRDSKLLAPHALGWLSENEWRCRIVNSSSIVAQYLLVCTTTANSLNSGSFLTLYVSYT